MTVTDTKLKWTTEAPAVQGWYWVKWKRGNTDMFFFDEDEWDIHKLTTDGELFYGPLQPPPEEDR